jgi:hypothetical protein
MILDVAGAAEIKSTESSYITMNLHWCQICAHADPIDEEIDLK